MQAHRLSYPQRPSWNSRSSCTYAVLPRSLRFALQSSKGNHCPGSTLHKGAVPQRTPCTKASGLDAMTAATIHTDTCLSNPPSFLAEPDAVTYITGMRHRNMQGYAGLWVGRWDWWAEVGVQCSWNKSQKITNCINRQAKQDLTEEKRGIVFVSVCLRAAAQGQSTRPCVEASQPVPRRCLGMPAWGALVVSSAMRNVRTRASAVKGDGVVVFASSGVLGKTWSTLG